jgi:hypothetical protein
MILPDGTGRVTQAAICSWPMTLRLCLILIVHVVVAATLTIMVKDTLVLPLFMK